jgi:hypothetical protein
MPTVAIVLAVLLVVVAALARLSPRSSRFRAAPSRVMRVLRAAGADIRDGLLAQRAWPWIVLASVVVVAGHTATFVIAARTAGTAASIGELLPLALLVLLAMSVPLNIGGWGPREGVAAWAFAAAGLGAAQGVAAAVVYGVLALVATLPGAVVLVLAWLHRRTPTVAGDGAVQPGSSGSGPRRPTHQQPAVAGGVAHV